MLLSKPFARTAFQADGGGRVGGKPCVAFLPLVIIAAAHILPSYMKARLCISYCSVGTRGEQTFCRFCVFAVLDISGTDQIADCNTD